MANAELMVPHIKKYEGGWANDPDDAGGCTMSGITIGTFQYYFGQNKTCADLKRITESQWLHIFKKGFWDKMNADNITNQSLAQLCVDMVWMSGAGAIKKIQAALGVAADGIVGKQTLGVLNENPRLAFYKLWVMRYNWLCEIAKKGNNKKFLKGWLRRLDSCKYGA